MPMAEWPGSFYFGDYWAAYRGAAGDNVPHAHATLQLTFALHGELVVEAENGEARLGTSLMVRPRVRHRLKPHPQVLLLLIEPHTQLCRSLLNTRENADIQVVPESTASKIDPQTDLASCLAPLITETSSVRPALDARLQKAIDWLDTLSEDPPLSAVAAHCEISLSRLRALATQELHVPLSKWILWRKLRRAAKEVAAGSDLASAALAGGFADQAHFSRTMKNLIGVTPGMATETLQ